ncbi:unnamed protein product [Coregonus sp. 'balchen']|nr:unnamed protein product [Coregonus sp. 'balchen']
MAEQIRASSGVITSPGWPFQYPSRINCSWNIRTNPGEIITISFQDFEIQNSHRCGLDWVSIGTYKNVDGYRACGSSIPAPYISSQDHVWIKFHSDDIMTGKGFRLSYITGSTARRVILFISVSEGYCTVWSAMTPGVIWTDV